MLPLLLSLAALSLAVLALLCLFFHGGRIERLEDGALGTSARIRKLAQRVNELERRCPPDTTESDRIAAASMPPSMRL